MMHENNKTPEEVKRIEKNNQIREAKDVEEEARKEINKDLVNFLFIRVPRIMTIGQLEDLIFHCENKILTEIEISIKKYENSNQEDL